MRFIVDEKCQPCRGQRTRGSGYAVVSVAKVSASLKDEDVYAMAAAQKAVLITRDHHFTNPIRFPSDKTGIIYIRHRKLKSEEEAGLLTDFLRNNDFRTIEGCLVTISKGRVSIRPAKQR